MYMYNVHVLYLVASIRGVQCTCTVPGGLHRRCTCTMYLPGGLHQRCTAGLGLVVYIRLSLQEEAHHLVMTLPAGKGKGRVIITARGDV